MASKILITGASGTVGSLVVRELSRRGIAVRAAIHTNAHAGRVREANAEIFEMDFARKESIERALSGIEKAYLLTPFVPDQPELAKNFIDAAKMAGVKHIVRQSAMGADVGAITVARQHREIEEYLKYSGIPATVLRPNFFMQNFINYFGGPIRAEGKIYLPLGDGKASYIDARDIATVAAIALTGEGHEGRAYNLTGPRALSVYDVADILSKAGNRKMKYVDIPEDAAREGMLKAKMDEWTVNALMELHMINKKGYASAVTNTIEALTGKPPITFEKFAADHAQFFKAAAN